MSNKENPYIVEKSEKDKTLDKIFWFKLIISALTGSAYGYLNLTGFICFLLFFIGSTILSFVYFKRIISEEEEVEYQSEVFIEGLNVSIPVFILSWTIIYTLNRVSPINNI